MAVGFKEKLAVLFGAFLLLLLLMLLLLLF